MYFTVVPACANGSVTVVPSARRRVSTGASLVLARVSDRLGCGMTTSAAAQLPPAFVRREAGPVGDGAVVRGGERRQARDVEDDGAAGGKVDGAAGDGPSCDVARTAGIIVEDPGKACVGRQRVGDGDIPGDPGAAVVDGDGEADGTTRRDRARRLPS